MPTDHVPFYTNEQYVSADLTSVQRQLERAIEDLAGYGVRPSGLSPSATGSSGGQPQVAFVGGLEALIDGVGLEVGPGMLLSTLVDAPDNPTLSGAYLVANPAAVTVPLPTPVADTWYVIAARPELVDEPPEARRLWDVSGGHWTPSSLVKLRRSVMAFDVVQSFTANNLPLVYPTNAAPLWAVFRPAGGGAVLQEHIIDLRPVRPLGGARNDYSNQGMAGVSLRQNQWHYTAAQKLRISAHIVHDNVDLHVVTYASGVEPIAFKNPDDAAPNDAGEWWHLYLARASGIHPLCAPRHAQLRTSDLVQQGLLVLSKVAPRSGDYGMRRVASADIRAPAPFAAQTIAGGDAAWIGSLYWYDGVWMPIQVDGDRALLFANVGGAPNASSGDFLFPHRAPVGARAATLAVTPDTAAGQIGFKTPDSTTTLATIHRTIEDATDIEVPLGPLLGGAELRLSGPTRVYTISLRGYRI